MSLRDLYKIEEVIYDCFVDNCGYSAGDWEDAKIAIKCSAKAIERNFVRRQKQPERIEIKERKNYCRVCGKYTTQIFNIDLKMAHICKNCEYRIVKQSIMDIYK